MRGRILVLVLVPVLVLVMGCDGSVTGGDTSPTPPSSPNPSPPPGPGPAPSPSPSPTQRVALQTLSPAQVQELYAALEQFARTQHVTRPIVALTVVHWNDAAGSVPADVSIVRGHYSIDHNSDFFFDHHRRYLAEVEAYLATLQLSYAPGGRVPWWDPAQPMPAPFGQVPRPGIDCYTAGRLDNTCDWEYGALATDFPNLPIPSRYRAGNICQQFATLHDLVQDFLIWHDSLHNRVGGMFRTFDAPAAPLFWIWHATVDDVYSSWLACGKP